MTTCTWKDCQSEATHLQIATDQTVWANLCQYHHEKMDAVIGKDARKMIAYWILAQGGAKAAANRMTGRR